MKTGEPLSDFSGGSRDAAAMFLSQIECQSTRDHHAEEIAVARDVASQTKQILFDECGLAGRHGQCGRVTDACDRGRMMPQPLEFGCNRPKSACARGRLYPTDCFDGLAEAQPMGERCDAGEAFRKEQGPVYRLSLNDLLDAAIFVKESRNRMNDILAHGLEQKMCGLGEVREHWADRHRETSRSFDDRRRPPCRLRFTGFEPLSHVEVSAHRIGAFRPVFVQNEFA